MSSGAGAVAQPPDAQASGAKTDAATQYADDWKKERSRLHDATKSGRNSITQSSSCEKERQATQETLAARRATQLTTKVNRRNFSSNVFCRKLATLLQQTKHGNPLIDATLNTISYARSPKNSQKASLTVSPNRNMSSNSALHTAASDSQHRSSNPTADK